MRNGIGIRWRWIVSISLLLALITSISVNLQPVKADNIRVPMDYPTIQAAIDAAVTGDVILITPGTYYENLVLANKTVTLSSLYYLTGDRKYISNTILNGQKRGPVIQVKSSVGPETTIKGLSIVNGTDGVQANAILNIIDNHISLNEDGIDYTDSGGILRGNLIENNSDDAVDFDEATDVLVENNILRNNRDDGIEIRLHEYSGPDLQIKIRNNQIYNNNSDGIQLIGYPNTTHRVIRIERNLIRDNLKAGLGLLDSGDTSEDYRAASLLEMVYVINNTFFGNNVAISGGDNLVAVNNIIAGSATLGIKNSDGSSIVSKNLFWDNGADQKGSNLDAANIFSANPGLDQNFKLTFGSPAIDKGLTQFDFKNQPVFEYLLGSFFGLAPDLGWMESSHSTDRIPSSQPTANPSLRFAVVGDYGSDSRAESDVAGLVNNWNPDLIVTTGDNNYPQGASSTIDQNIGQYYSKYIYPYLGSYGDGADNNRFFPSLGNHDMDTRRGQPYLDYFTLPGNERYYDFVRGPVHFFILNSDSREVDGINAGSAQAQWLQPRLEGSTTPWQVVIFHHAPYSSGLHGSTSYMRWPFAEWGADAVLTGHDHTYERLVSVGLPYIVNGVGGHVIYDFVKILPESVVRYNDGHGAMLVEASATTLDFEFYDVSNTRIDAFTIEKSPLETLTPAPSATTAVPAVISIPTPVYRLFLPRLFWP